MSTRQDYIIKVGQLVQGEIPLGEPDKILAIDMAVKEHSRHRPQIVVEDVTGDGGFDYALSELASWSEGFSVVKSVEYQIDDTKVTVNVLLDEEWQIYRKPEGRCLRFLEDTPESDEEFRVIYTALHTCTDSACTVEAFDDEAVQVLAGAFFCELLATYYAQSTDSTIAADSVDHRSKAQEYSVRAKTYRKIYFDHLGIKEGETPPASVTHDWDKDASWGSDKATHGRKYR